MNNGTGTAEFVQASVSFYDPNHEKIGNEFSYANPSIQVSGLHLQYLSLVTAL
jgi:hypothetical protein